MSDAEVLEARAAHFLEIILDVAKGPGGMLIAFCHYDTRMPFQEGEELHEHLANILDGVWGGNSPKPTVAEWFYGENTLWATGMLLWSQILRYRATQEPEAFETARKCFRDLSHIFRLCREIEPGLLGKPHAGRAGDTTSFDQAANPVLFYAIYAQELATPEEKAEATENMALHGDYYLRRNWVMNHHGNLARIVDPAHTSTMKYLACIHAAYDLTGETRFRDAAYKYLRQLKDLGRLPWPTNPYELNHNAYYYAFLSDYWSRTEIADEMDWVGYINEYWQVMQRGLGEDGLILHGQFDTATREFTPYPNRWVLSEESDQLPTLDRGERLVKRRWVSSTSFAGRSTVSCYAASLGLLAQSHGLDDNAHEIAQRILLQLDEDDMRWWWGDETLPEELEPLLNIYGPEVPGAWLSAYWLGRWLDTR